jgi:S-adenosylmethionine:tRNA ribosyltransferase-isomerase
MEHKKLSSKIKIESFNYDLPQDKIAFFPKENRDEAKLLVYQNQSITDATFKDLPSYLSENDILIFNNSKVIHARLIIYNNSGAKIEIFCLEPIAPTAEITLAFEQTKSVTWKCFVGNARKWKTSLQFDVPCKNRTVQVTTTKSEPVDGSFNVTFEWDNDQITFADWLDAYGKMPLPPYIKREADLNDEARYQTIFAKHDGSVAAPTAGLHFTDSVFESLKQKKIDTQWITLHVGAGTFKPVNTEFIEDHFMHQEQIIVSKELIHNLLATQNKRIIAVGTTVTRTLESIFVIGAKLKLNLENPFHVSQWEVYDLNRETPIMQIRREESLQSILDYLDQNRLSQFIGYTSLLIKPGYQHKIAKGILTNFHQPQSTLLLLISSYLGEDWRTIYEHALGNNYRFLSYGDANLYL